MGDGRMCTILTGILFTVNQFDRCIFPCISLATMMRALCRVYIYIYKYTSLETRYSEGEYIRMARPVKYLVILLELFHPPKKHVLYNIDR